MATLISSLLQLQSVEHQLWEVRSRLKTRKNAVLVQTKRIEQLEQEHQALLDKAMARRKDADTLDLDLKTREAEVNKYRTALNTAKTNKEYAAILTQINTSKADSAKLEEEALKIMAEVDAIKAQAAAIEVQLQVEKKRLEEVQAASSAEIQRLEGMLAQLETQRSEAAASIPPEPLATFERMAEKYEGDALAMIEVHGRKPPFDYVCGGCFMSLNAEHANMLRVRDDLRRCDNCGRILYMEDAAKKSPV